MLDTALDRWKFENANLGLWRRQLFALLAFCFIVSVSFPSFSAGLAHHGTHGGDAFSPAVHHPIDPMNGPLYLSSEGECLNSCQGFTAPGRHSSSWNFMRSFVIRISTSSILPPACSVAPDPHPPKRFV